MNLVRTHVSREPHMTIDGLGVEQLQVAPRKAFEHAAISLSVRSAGRREKSVAVSACPRAIKSSP